MTSRLPEDFLHYVWKFGFFDKNNLTTTKGTVLQITHSGIHNQDAGPDFLQAQIFLDNRIWFGNIEIHYNSSDWDKHKHSEDRNYASIILHVVFYHDKEIDFLENNAIETLEIGKLISQQLIQNHKKLLTRKERILCSSNLISTSSITIKSTIEHCAIERIQHKLSDFYRLHNLAKNNWEELSLLIFARCFGGKTNADPFERLIRSIGFQNIFKLRSDLFILESVLFGQSGLLEDNISHSYVSAIQKEYTFQRKKYALAPMKHSDWKFSRLRPTSFPTLRIAQFARFLFQCEHLYNLINLTDIQDILEFLNFSIDGFWNTHYNFKKTSTFRVKKVGHSFKSYFVINGIVPLLFYSGIKKDDQSFKDRALKMLESLSPEKNNIVKSWHEIGVTIDSAFDSQGLIQLNNYYCRKKRCLECKIGHQIVSNI